MFDSFLSIIHFFINFFNLFTHTKERAVLIRSGIINEMTHHTKTTDNATGPVVCV